MKVALERLLGAPCYHMVETFEKPDHVSQWRNAVDGVATDWDLVFDAYAAKTGVKTSTNAPRKVLIVASSWLRAALNKVIAWPGKAPIEPAIALRGCNNATLAASAPAYA